MSGPSLNSVSGITTGQAPAATTGRRRWRRFASDRSAVAGLVMMSLFLVMATGVWLGWWAQGWSAPVGSAWESPSSRHWLGTTLLGQDILARAIYSTRTAFEIGLLVAVASTALGALLGALSGYFSGTSVDALILWFKGVLEAIPFYLFVAALAYALAGNPWSMHIAMIATFWTATARLVRGEVIRIKQLPFVEAARAMGLKPLTVLFRHIVPLTLPILLVQATIAFVAAIQSEVILSFLGLGTQNSMSWGLMIAESATEVIAGHYWNFIAASSFLFAIVLAFNLLADGLQQALDPKSRVVLQ